MWHTVMLPTVVASTEAVSRKALSGEKGHAANSDHCQSRLCMWGCVCGGVCVCSGASIASKLTILQEDLGLVIIHHILFFLFIIILLSFFMSRLLSFSFGLSVCPLGSVNCLVWSSLRVYFIMFFF